MATISAAQLKSLYQQLASQGYSYPDIVALAQQFDVTEQELNDALSGKVTEIGYEEPDSAEKTRAQAIADEVAGKQTEKKMGAEQATNLIKDIQRAGYSINQIYDLAAQYDVSPEEVDALLGGTATEVSYRDPTSYELAQYAAIVDANQQAKAKPPPEDLNVTRSGYKDRVGEGLDISGSTGLRDAYMPYVERMLERASAEADVPFQAYEGISPLIQKAQSGIANLKTPGQFLQGSNLATAAGIGALGYGQYKPTQFTTGTFANPLQGTRGDIINFAQNYADRPVTSQEVSALDNYLRANPNTTFRSGVDALYASTQPPTGKAYGGEVEGYQTGGDVTVGGTQPDLMNPSLQPINYGGQNVTNVQASYMSPYMQNVVDVQQREAKRQADIANQAIGARAAQAGAFGGTRHGLMEAEANRNLQTQLGGIQAKGLQDAFSQGLSQFNVEQNRGLEAQKLGEQSRQFGAELGLKGLQTGIQSAGVLGQLGAAESASDLARLKTLYDMGTGERTFDYNEFLRSEKYPYENLKFMQSMLTGLPIDAAASGVSPSANALKALLASAGVLFPD